MLRCARFLFLPLAAFLAGMFLTTLLYAQPELTYLYGKLKSPDAHDRASINQLEYLQELPGLLPSVSPT